MAFIFKASYFSQPTHSFFCRNSFFSPGYCRRRKQISIWHPVSLAGSLEFSLDTTPHKKKKKTMMPHSSKTWILYIYIWYDLFRRWLAFWFGIQSAWKTEKCAPLGHAWSLRWPCGSICSWTPGAIESSWLEAYPKTKPWGGQEVHKNDLGLVTFGTTSGVAGHCQGFDLWHKHVPVALGKLSFPKGAGKHHTAHVCSGGFVSPILRTLLKCKLNMEQWIWHLPSFHAKGFEVFSLSSCRIRLNLRKWQTLARRASGST